MMQENDLVKWEGSLYRILVLQDNEVLMIDCVKRIMPVWHKLTEISSKAVLADSQTLQKDTGVVLECFENACVQRQNEAHKRFSVIAGLVSVVGERKPYTQLLNEISIHSDISKQTLRRYLCDFLAFQDIACLLPADISKEKGISDNEKMFRWALNKWFYNQNQHTLQWTYNQMLRERYCDANGKLLPDRPSFNQFRYYYRKTRSEQNYLISRNGIGDYKRNGRPLLGDCLQARFPNIGTGMLDGTVCDIYLVDDSGNVIGRPVLTACIDAHTSLCCGYCLSWEAGTYNLRNLMMNTICNKREWCKQHNIIIDQAIWPCSSLPGVMITDKGSEYISENFSQITELGVTLIDLEPFRPDLKPMVEKFFDIIQSYFKNELKGCGVVERDFGERTNRTDYRRQACLTMEQFEAILIRSIVYYNGSRTLENYPYTPAMIDRGLTPTAAGVWGFKRKESGTNLIDVDRQRLSLVLLPRTTGRFSRDGLRVNKLRYVHCIGNYIDQYLTGGDAVVAYSPDNVSRVWLIDNGEYVEFHLIESRYKDLSVQSVEEIKERTRQLIKEHEEAKLQAQIDLSNQIREIASAANHSEKKPKSIRENRKREIVRSHIEIGGEAL